MRHAGGDGSHGRVPSALAAWAVVAPYRNRLPRSLTEPRTASIHSEVVGHARSAVARTAGPAVVGPMVITWKGANHKSKLTTGFYARKPFLIRSNRVHQ